MIKIFLYLLIIGSMVSCKQTNKSSFPSELVSFTASPKNPVFKGTDSIKDWDETIRERGYILKEGDQYHMWYTGYKKSWEQPLALGYASSTDGIVWTRYAGNPIYDSLHTEDMMVIKDGDIYHMFAEGKDDIAHRLSSADRIHWHEHGSLDIRKKDGKPLEAGPYGTPTVLKEDGIWYLFYERNDSAVWLASSRDLVTWTNVQDEPVLKKGPAPYDLHGVAMNQIVKNNGKYYGYYHGTPDADWATWNVNVAVSDDKIHWTKYENNPILKDNKSSGILVHDGKEYRLYSMHPEVCVHFNKPE